MPRVPTGPSGCGKSTLPRMIAGLKNISDGQIRFGDRDVTDLEPVDEQMGEIPCVHADAPGGERIVVEQRGNRDIDEDRDLDVHVPPGEALPFTEDGARIR